MKFEASPGGFPTCSFLITHISFLLEVTIIWTEIVTLFLVFFIGLPFMNRFRYILILRFFP